MDVFESYPRSLLLSLGSSVMAVYKRSSRRMKNRSFLKEEGARRRHAFDGKEWTNEFAEDIPMQNMHMIVECSYACLQNS